MCTERVLQVAIVDTDDASVRSQCAIEFGAGVYFDERFHVQLSGESDQVAQERVGERGDDEQETVGIISAGFPDLPGIEDEVLAKGGKGNILAGIAEILERATEELAFCENGERHGASGFERLGKCGRIERIAYDASRGRRWL